MLLPISVIDGSMSSFTENYKILIINVSNRNGSNQGGSIENVNIYFTIKNTVPNVNTAPQNIYDRYPP